MSSNTDNETTQQDDEGFVQRWSRVKYQGQSQAATIHDKLAEEIEQQPELEMPGDDDMPSIDSLTEDSDYIGFLSPNVSEQLRKQALRKLFSSPAFNIRDGLDDYDGEYTQFAKLGDIITADLKHQLEMESKKKLQQLADANIKEQETEMDSHVQQQAGLLEETVNSEQNIIEPSDDVEAT